MPKDHSTSSHAREEYDAWAPYYDLVHPGLPGEAEFYVLEGVRCGGEVLELGAGTGRIAIPLALSGGSVLGLDISPEMLAVCREKVEEVGPLQGRLRLVEGDMRCLDLGERFARIFCPYRSFMHLLTYEEQTACLRSVRAHLAPEGRFVMNQWAARPSAVARAMQAAPKGRLMPVDRYPLDDGAYIEHYHAASYDEHHQTIREEHLMREFNRKGKALHEARLALTRAWTTPREMEALARGCGFAVDAVYGDFFGGPFTADSTEMIWMLRRDDEST